MDSMKDGEQLNNDIDKALRTLGFHKIETPSCNHDWRAHTTVNDTVPTGEKHELTGAEINRIENRVTKVYCSRCLEVRGI